MPAISETSNGGHPPDSYDHSETLNFTSGGALNPVAPRFKPPHALTLYNQIDDKQDQLERKMAMLQQQMALNDSTHIGHSMQACRLSNATREDLEETKAMFRSDLRMVIEEVNMLKHHVRDDAERSHKEKLAAAAKNPQICRIASGELCEDKSMTMAEAYISEAEAAEAMANELRKMAIEATKNIACEAEQGNKSKECSNGAVTLVHPDMPVPTIEDPALNSDWQPRIIREMAPLAGGPTGSKSSETFTYAFLSSIFKGTEQSPGFYWVSGQQAPIIRSYYILENTHEPYLPAMPGAHGAKLTAFFNPFTDDCSGPDETAYKTPSPLFIAGSPDTYTYYGMYTQPRFSDRLDIDTMTAHVPHSVKAHWASTLSSPGRPAWVTEALMAHFWPAPIYDGPIPHDSEAGETLDTVTETGVKAKKEKKLAKAGRRYLAELGEWEKDARLKVNLMRESDVLKAFEESDASEEPGLRLWWEYLRCESWDESFYAMLVSMKGEKGC